MRCPGKSSNALALTSFGVDLVTRKSLLHVIMQSYFFPNPLWTASLTVNIAQNVSGSKPTCLCESLAVVEVCIYLDESVNQIDWFVYDYEATPICYVLQSSKDSVYSSIFYTLYFRHTTKQNSYFCSICGYPNLRRIPVTLHDDGQLEFHFSRRFKKNLRGTKVGIWVVSI